MGFSDLPKVKHLLEDLTRTEIQAAVISTWPATNLSCFRVSVSVSNWGHIPGLKIPSAELRDLASGLLMHLPRASWARGLRGGGIEIKSKSGAD